MNFLRLALSLILVLIHAVGVALPAQNSHTQTTASPQLALANPLRQPGQYLDAETGLHYNDRRYYDADTGRYASRDPIGFEGGINLYTYAAAAPSRFTDPTGEIIPCVAASFARCMIVCGITSAGFNAATGQCIDLGDIAKDCAVDCLLSMLPIPDPCGRFGKLFGAAIGIGAGLANSFEADTLVHTRILTDSGYQTRLKPIKDIQIGDEVLAWDELQAHDNAALAQFTKAGQAAPTLQEAHNAQSAEHSTLQANLTVKTATNPSKCCSSSYENNSNRNNVDQATTHATTHTPAQPTSAQRYEKVTDIASSFKAQTLLHITLDNGQTIQATAGHPFKTSEGWRDAVMLKKGGKLLLRGGDADANSDAHSNSDTNSAERYATITDIREEVKTTAVFNLEVANLHTFFVGEEGLVVHNARRGPIPPPGFTRTNDFSHGQPVYKNGRTFISPDIGSDGNSHNGGVWKKCSGSPKNLKNKTTRDGTYNADLTIRIGD
jgi:RHS repeat-associated protein